uniref:Uncharacterized protein n=1 Tax=Eutreptiella gymnastica TaxID=73025 RepID=A0A7S4GGY8_9EUGL
MLLSLQLTASMRTSIQRSGELHKECRMVHQCYPDKCFNIGHGCVCTKCNSKYPFSMPQEIEEMNDSGGRLLYRRYEAEDACVVPHNRRLLVRLRCHNNVQRITPWGWELFFAKYLTNLGKS